MQTKTISGRDSTAGNPHRTPYGDLFGPVESNDPDGAARPPELKGWLTVTVPRRPAGKKTGERFLPPKGSFVFFGKDVKQLLLESVQDMDFFPAIPMFQTVGETLAGFWARPGKDKCRKNMELQKIPGWIFSNIQRSIETWEILFGI